MEPLSSQPPTSNSEPSQSPQEPQPQGQDPSQTPAAGQPRTSADAADFASAHSAASDQDFARQIQILKAGEIEILGRGGDPLYEMTPAQAGVSSEAQMEYMSGLTNKRYLDMRTAADTAGWGDLYGFMKEVTDQYRAENALPLERIHALSTEEQKFKAATQLRPIEIDPNRVAEMRQLAVGIDQAIKAVDPQMSFWTHPEFKDVSEWLNREAGGSTKGFFTSGEQDMPLSADIAEAGLAGGEAFTDMGLGIAYTAWEGAAKAVEWAGGEIPGPPTNYIIDERTGEMIVNTARPNPGITELVSKIRNAGDEKAYMEEITALAGARRQWELQAGTGAKTLRMASQLVGMIGLPPIGKFKGMPGGFTPAMKAMNTGGMLGSKLVHKGLVKIGADTTKRGAKIMETLGKVAGASGGNAAAMTLAYGRTDDYATQASHGAVIAPILMAMGAMGKGAERMLRTRANMPGRMAASIGGALEGVGFGAMEDIQTRGLWEFLKNPTPDNWSTYLGNMAGMAFVKGAANQRPNLAHESDAQTIAGESAKAVRGVAEGRVDPKDVRPEAKAIGKAEVEGAPRRHEDIQKIYAEGVSPKERQKRQTQAALDADGPFGVPRDYRYERPADPPTAEQATVKKLMEAQVKHALDAPVGGARRAPAGSESEAAPKQVAEGVSSQTFALGEQSAFSEKQLKSEKITLPKLLAKFQGVRGKDPVQMEMREGRTGGALAFVKKIGVSRNKNLSNIAAHAHEWTHESMAMMARRRRGPGAEHLDPRQATQSREINYQSEAQDFAALGEGQGLRDARRILEDYPGSEKWFEAIDDPAAHPATKAFALYKVGSETFAEIGARKLLGDQTVDMDAPMASNAFESMMAEPHNAAWARQFRGIEQGIRTWRAVGSYEREIRSASETKKSEAKARIAREGGPVKGRAILYAKKTSAALFDELAMGRKELHDAARAQDIIPKDIPIEADPFRIHDVTKGTDQKMVEEILESGTFNAAFERTGEGMKEVLGRVEGDGITQSQFWSYMNAKRGLEEVALGHETTATRSDYEAILVKLSGKSEALAEHAQAFKEVFGRTVDWVAEVGGLSKEGAKVFKDQRFTWVSYMRAISEFANGQGGTGAVSTATTRGGGGAKMAFSEATTATLSHLVRMGNRARVHQGLLKAADMGFGTVAEIIKDKGVNAQDYSKAEILKKLRESATTEEDHMALDILIEGDVSAGDLTLFTGKTLPGQGDKFIIPINRRMPEGVPDKTEWVRVGADTWNSLIHSDTAIPATNVVARGLRKGATIFRKTSVELNPKFALGALARDVMMRPSTTRGGILHDVPGARYLPVVSTVAHLADVAAGAAKLWGNSKFAQRLNRAGLTQATQAHEGMSETKMREALGSVDRGKLAEIGSFMRKIATVGGRGLGAMGKAVEQGPRIQSAESVYNRARKAGKSEEVAMLESAEAYREELVNFVKGGVVTRSLGRYVPFLNAAFRGQEKFLQAISTKKGLAAAIANITAPAMAAYLMHQEQDWFRDLQEWEKHNYIHISKDVRIPIPYELGVLFSSIPRHAADFAKEQPGYQPSANIWIQSARDLLIPMARDATSFLPPILKVQAETESGHSFFKGKQIVPEFIRNTRKPEDQTGYKQGEAWRDTFLMMPRTWQALGVSNPAELENAARGLVPGLPIDALNAATKSDDVLEGINALTIDRFRTPHGRGSRANDQIKERLVELKQDGKSKTGEYKKLLRARRKISKLYEDESLTGQERSTKIRDIAMDAMGR